MADDVTYTMSGDGVELTYATAARTLDLLLTPPLSGWRRNVQLPSDWLSVTATAEYGLAVTANLDFTVEPHIEVSHRITVFLPPVTTDPPAPPTVDGLIAVATIESHRVDARTLPAPTFSAVKLTGTVAASAVTAGGGGSGG